MRRGKAWTQEEVDFLYANRDKTAREIADELHRTIQSVKCKRYFSRISSTSPRPEFVPIAMSPCEKEARIIRLAKEMRVRLGVER